MSMIGMIRATITQVGGKAGQSARSLNQISTKLNDELREIDTILGDSATEVDKAMARALSEAIGKVDEAIVKLTEFQGTAQSYGSRL